MRVVSCMAAVAGLALAGSALAQNGFTINSGTARYTTGAFNAPYASDGAGVNQSSLWVNSPYTAATSATVSMVKDTWAYRYNGQGQTSVTTPFHPSGFGNGVVESASGNAATSSKASNGTTAGGLFSDRFTFTLFQPAAGQAVLQIDLQVTNLSTNVINMQIYNLVDQRLLGTQANDTLTTSLLTSGSLSGIRMDDGTGMYMIHYADNIDRYQAGTGGNAAGTTMGNAYGNLPLANTLINNPADNASGFSWDVTILPGLSVTRTAYYLVNTDQIPAPGAMALLGLGGLVAARRRRA